MIFRLLILLCILATCSLFASGQSVSREINISSGQLIEIINRSGRVDILAESVPKADPESKTPPELKLKLAANSKSEISESDIVSDSAKGRTRIVVSSRDRSKRIDLTITVPERSRMIVETDDGGIRAEGNFESIIAKTDTGTIAVDVPTDDLKYDLWWTTSKPRYLADFEVDKVNEKSGGRFQIKGNVGTPTPKKKKKKEEPKSSDVEKPAESPEGNGTSNVKDPKTEDQTPRSVALNFTTARGIILLNVPPSEVMSDLRERPLTEAAKAIVRSGDSFLLEAIRRASPKYFGDYAKTLPPVLREPTLRIGPQRPENPTAGIKTVNVRVTDIENRAIGDLEPGDFEVTENSQPREIVSVKRSTAPFNLVLLVDVSGSVDDYVNFIRKAARAFVDTVDANDRISIVIFNDDVKSLSGFTTDKPMLSKSLDTFDARGGTAYYDAIAYTLTETLRPLRGERTAIVVLTDGDDNRSFLPFDSLMGTIEESGALIYPLYVPSSLLAAAANAPTGDVDPLRSKYLNVSLSSKARGEGPRLAKASGGVYYPITQLSQIQTAYEDIVAQLRTAYDITFRSDIASPDGMANPRLKVRSRKPGTYVQLGRVSAK